MRAGRAGMSVANRWLAHPAAGPLFWLVLALPLVWLVAAAVGDRLGANPAEALVRSLGDWALRCLALTLAFTPLRHWTGWHQLMRHRRAAGLACFAYASLHWSAYAWLDQGWELHSLLADVAKRPFILVGTLAWLCLLPLAATSMSAAQRWLGGRRWQQLHRLVYLIAPLALLHFLWMRAGKRLYLEVAVYAAVFALLLGWRVWHRHRRKVLV